MNLPSDSESSNDSSNEETVSLLFETSPYGSIDAIVEHDGRAVFFYLSGKNSFGTRACWVRNLKPGPYVVNADEMQAGIPPLLPRTHCKYPDPLPAPITDELSIVWFEEGNGAALLENEMILAVIPPWSGSEGFHGYAAECASESPICWPLPDHPQLKQRIARASEFWQQFESKENNPFVDLQKQTLHHYRERLGEEAAYYAIDGGQFPPRGLARFQTGNLMTLATVGMGLCPQPNVEMYVEHPRLHRRIELAIQIDLGEKPFDPETVQPLLEQIGRLASYPWRNWNWFGHGHSCEISQLPQFLDETFRFALMLNDEQATGGQRDLLQFRDDPVQLLWLIPITEQEQQRVANGENLLTALSDSGRLPASR